MEFDQQKNKTMIGYISSDINLQFPALTPSTDHLLDGAAIALLGEAACSFGIC